MENFKDNTDRMSTIFSVSRRLSRTLAGTRIALPRCLSWPPSGHALPTELTGHAHLEPTWLWVSLAGYPGLRVSLPKWAPACSQGPCSLLAWVLLQEEMPA